MFARLVAAVAVGLTAVLVAGGLGTMLTRTVAAPVAPAVAVLAVGLVVLVVLYGRGRARGTATGYW
jgi:hypothetical protein